ncbi:MAG: YafY family transcriptional regulator [Marinosulfonomonas sp.]|nr:YafY family transcriptional regulator [Marinosulfonomonas sp.]
MRRADRLFQIVQYLRGGRLVTARQMAERLEVSERTIYRDVADLIGSGVPIEGEAGVGYVMRAGYDMPPLMFSRDEIVALVTGARLVRAWGGTAMARAAQEALIKIDAVLPERERERVKSTPIFAISMNTMDDQLRDRIDQLERLTEDRVRLQIGYRDGEGLVTQRTIRPLGLWFWGKVWTLVAWCELREDFRMFRIDRIEHITQAGTFRDERDKNLMAFYRLQVAQGHAPPDRSY